MKDKEQIKLTLLDYAILGLIQEQALSGYAIRKFFEVTALGNFSSSPGSIYPAIKRLQKFELVHKNAQSAIEITEKGTSILRDWFLKPIEKIEVEKKVNELLLRFSFMEGLLDKNQKIKFLETFQQLLKIYISELQEFYNKEEHNMPLHGKLAFQYGIDSNKTTLKWCKKAMLQLV